MVQMMEFVHDSVEKKSGNLRKCWQLKASTTGKYSLFHQLVVAVSHWLFSQTFPFLPFPKQALVFTCLQYKSFENTAGKEEIAHNKQFLHLPQCFLPVWRPSSSFLKI